MLQSSSVLPSSQWFVPLTLIASAFRIFFFYLLLVSYYHCSQLFIILVILHGPFLLIPTLLLASLVMRELLIFILIYCGIYFEFLSNSSFFQFLLVVFRIAPPRSIMLYFLSSLVDICYFF